MCRLAAFHLKLDYNPNLSELCDRGYFDTFGAVDIFTLCKEVEG